MRLIIWIYGLSFVCPSASWFKSSTYHHKNNNFCLKTKKHNFLNMLRMIFRELQILIQYQLMLKLILRVIMMYFKAVFHFRLWALFFLGYASYQIYELFHVWKLPCTIVCGEVCNTNGNVIPSKDSKLLCLKYDLPNICWVWNAMPSNLISISILEYKWYAD